MLSASIEKLVDREKIGETHPFLLRTRQNDTHKGSFGTVAVIGGSPGMMGAAALSAMAALKMGCGKVVVGFYGAKSAPTFSDVCPELMFTDAESALKLKDVTCFVVGCGLGLTNKTMELIDYVWQNVKVPVVYDADALTLISLKERPDLMSNITERIFTPHPGEAARLLGKDVSAVQSDRRGSASSIAQMFQATTVLKGNRSIIASVYGKTWENPTGNPGLATAGTGDVLTGMVASLIAQGCAPIDALRAAVWMHGAAADVLVDAGVGPIGLVASELIDAARSIRNYMARP